MDREELQEAELDFAIDIEQDWQCKWWSHDFRVTPEEVKAAVLEVGSSANAVRQHLMRGRTSGGVPL